MSMSVFRYHLTCVAMGLATVMPIAMAEPVHAQAAASTESQAAMMSRLRSIATTLHPHQGIVALDSASAVLDLGNAYDFYDAGDARKILVDIWGNPPGSEEGVLGLVMPAGNSPISDTWGAVITYEDTGYVSDEDAQSTDYSELLDQLKQAQESANGERSRLGYPAMHLVGWAEEPSYDKNTHALIWARNFSTEGDRLNGLNYDFRLLGRKGVLSINFISQMPQLGSIRAAAQAFSGKASFDPGSRYEDFDPSTDRAAEYGVGGLIAAGAGVAAAKKFGLLALLAKFWKLIAVGFVALLAAVRGFFGRLFGRNGPE